jgi:hypothetical protein
MRRSLPHSRRSRLVIRKPDRVKKIDTPRKPPLAHENPPWKHSTATTASPRSPSSAGRWVRREGREAVRDMQETVLAQVTHRGRGSGPALSRHCANLRLFGF